MPISKKQKQATRLEILNSAYHLFSTVGYEASSIDKICQRAGVTRGAFYGHFQSKRELFIESFRYQAARGQLNYFIKQEDKGKDWLPTVVEQYVRTNIGEGTSETCPMVYLWQDASKLGSDVKSFYSDIIRYVAQGVCTSMVNENQENMALGIVALMIGTVSIARSTESAEQQEQLLKSCLAIIEHLNA